MLSEWSEIATPVRFCTNFLENHTAVNLKKISCGLANQWPHCRGNAFLFLSSQELPRLCLRPLRTFLSCHMALFNGLWLALCIASTTTEIQQEQSQVCRKSGPRPPPRTADANLDCAFLDNALAFVNCKNFGWPFDPLIWTVWTYLSHRWAPTKGWQMVVICCATGACKSNRLM